MTKVGQEITLREHLSRAGSVRGGKKADAARRNGSLGGRPRSVTIEKLWALGLEFSQRDGIATTQIKDFIQFVEKSRS